MHPGERLRRFATWLTLPISLPSTHQAQDAGACLAAFYRQALRKATVELPVEFRLGGH